MKLPAGSTLSPERPWIGLRSFSESTADYFFGRTEELQELFERVEHKPLTILFGQSGLGKTSLLHAGLMPKLRQAGYLPVSIRLAYVGQDQGLEQQVLSELRAALGVTGSVAAANHIPAEGVGLWELFHRPDFGLISPDGPPVVQPVLIFDQFEEIFTQAQSQGREVEAFFSSLAGLIENRPPEALRERWEADEALADRIVFDARPCRVLLSLREDFLHQLERWRRLMPSLMENRFELRPLNGAKALLAVYEPGTRRPDKPPIVTRDTAEAIVRFVAGADDPNFRLSEIDAVPPLLSLICAELNAQRLEAGQEQIDFDPRGRSGRREKILERFYTDCFADQPAGVRELVEDRLLSAEGHRESLALDSALLQLESCGFSRAEAEGAIARLVDNRLLVVGERHGVRRVELTHDVLTGVARGSRDRRREREAEERRRQAEARERATRRRLQLARLALAIMVVLLAGAISAFVWALTERDKARHALKQARKSEEKARVAEGGLKKFSEEVVAQRNEAIKLKTAAEAAATAAIAMRNAAEANRGVTYLLEMAQSYDDWKRGLIGR
ncbi:MAG: hypothetical protein JO069_08765, partial [Verrucomicrobia bacterium]|nr:hypothetical protein [Verrucomicrobiota bacterium]